MRTLLLLILSAFGLWAQVEQGLLVNLMARPAGAVTEWFTNADFSTSLWPLSGTNWALNGSGSATNGPNWVTNLISDQYFSASNYFWDVTAAPGLTIHDNVADINSTASSILLRSTYTAVGYTNWTLQNAMIGGNWYKYGVTLTNVKYTGVDWGQIGQPNVSSAGPPDLANSHLRTNGTWSGTWGMLNQNASFIDFSSFTSENLTTGQIHQVSFRPIQYRELLAVADLGKTDVSASCTIASMPLVSTGGRQGSCAGLVLRNRWCWNAIAIGDSKTTVSYDWKYPIPSPILCQNDAIGYSGLGTFRIYTNANAYDFPVRWPNYDIALINSSVNDDGITDSNLYASYLTLICSNLQAKWPDIHCYLANVACSNRNMIGINNAVDLCVANNSSYVHKGMDERASLNTNNWSVNWIEGIHYNAAGCTAAAAAWSTAIGTPPNAPSGRSDAIFVYFDNMDNKIRVVENSHGSNIVRQSTSATYGATKLLCASINGNKLKVFYGGTQVGTATNLAALEVNVGTQFGLFATDPGTQFSTFACSNSTSSSTAP